MLTGQLIKEDIGACSTIGVTTNEYAVSVTKHKLRRPNHKWEDHIKMTLEII
jgi:hypothetical protein